MLQRRRRETTRMYIMLNLLRKYHRPHIPETGKEIRYDIQQFKENPQTPNPWYRQRTKTDSTQGHLGDAEENREQLNQKIQTGIQYLYPIMRQQ